MRQLDPVTWFASGYTSSEEWVGWLFYALLSVPLMVALWIGWRVFRSGAKPRRDAALTWVMLAASSLCAGLAYPRDPLVLIPAVIAAVLAGGCSVRTRQGGSSALLAIVVTGWILWLPASLILALALR